MVPFFYIAVLIYGSCSSSLEPIMEDLAKEDSKVHLNQTSVATSNNFMADLLANPKEFVAQFAQLDPVELKKIITLLSALKGTSEAREAHLLGVWNDKIAEAVITGNAVVAAQTAVNDAQTVVTNAEGAVVDAEAKVTDAKAVVTTAKAVKVVKQQELASADTAHTTKLGEKDAAKKTHDDEIVQLDDEQKVLSDVIVMLEQLHSKQGFTLVEWNAPYSYRIGRTDMVYGTLDVSTSRLDDSPGGNFLYPAGSNNYAPAMAHPDAEITYFKDRGDRISYGFLFTKTMADKTKIGGIRMQGGIHAYINFKIRVGCMQGTDGTLQQEMAVATRNGQQVMDVPWSFCGQAPDGKCNNNAQTQQLAVGHLNEKVDVIFDSLIDCPVGNKFFVNLGPCYNPAQGGWHNHGWCTGQSWIRYALLIAA